MTDDSQPVPPGQRPPASAWLRAVLTLGPALAGALVAGLRANAPEGAVTRAGGFGLAVGLLLVGGLELSERFFARRTARMFGSLAFAALLAVGGAAVGFAGCIPYPHFETLPPRRSAAVPPASTSTRPGSSPAPAQPSPRKVFVVTPLVL